MYDMSEDSMDREKHCAAHKSKKKKKHKYNDGKAESLGSLYSGNDRRLLHEKKTLKGHAHVRYLPGHVFFSLKIAKKCVFVLYFLKNVLYFYKLFKWVELPSGCVVPGSSVSCFVNFCGGLFR